MDQKNLSWIKIILSWMKISLSWIKIILSWIKRIIVMDKSKFVMNKSNFVMADVGHRTSLPIPNILNKSSSSEFSPALSNLWLLLVLWVNRISAVVYQPINHIGMNKTYKGKR